VLTLARLLARLDPGLRLGDADGFGFFALLRAFGSARPATAVSVAMA